MSANSWFYQQIADWYIENQRELPWRGSKNPYQIWLSEVIFQQTRIEQGLPYFQRFFSRFPTVEELASAEEDEVLRLWEGLGYYSRARNLYQAAVQMVKENAGKFPSSYQEWLKVKGVGKYTAASISSICLDEVEAAVDGNVYRVLSRFLADATPIDTTAGQNFFKKEAQKRIHPLEPGNHNQGLMDLGAMVCTPRNPSCLDCPLVSRCLAHKQQAQQAFPVKMKKIKVTQRTLLFLVLEGPDGVLIRKRPSGDIWPGLYEFIPFQDEQSLRDFIRNIDTSHRAVIPKKVSSVSHLLTHQKLQVEFFVSQVKTAIPTETHEWKKREELNELSFPKPLRNFLLKFLY